MAPGVDRVLCLAERPFLTEGVDFSPEMIDRARAKVPEARFTIGDVWCPPLSAAAYDVVLSRHVLRAVPDPETVYWGMAIQDERYLLVSRS